MIIKPSLLSQSIEKLIEARLPGLVQGPPGVGKSSIFRQTAERLGMAFHDIRAVLLDPVDLRGVPYVKDGRTHWAVPDFLPKEGPAIVLIDEINSAPSLVQAALYQLILDRKIGEYELPEDVYVFGAGNRDTDGAVTTRMGTAMRSRFVQIELEPDVDDWTEHAITSDFHEMVIGFIRWRPNLLFDFDKNAKAFPCPRTWEFVSKVMKTPTPKLIEHALVEGAIGPGAATEFMAFLKLARDLPSIDSILLNPDKAPVPTSPATLFAVATALALKASADNMSRLITYLDRLPAEYNVLCIKTALAKNEGEIKANKKVADIAKTKAFISWSIRYQDVVGCYHLTS